MMTHHMSYLNIDIIPVAVYKFTCVSASNFNYYSNILASIYNSMELQFKPVHGVVFYHFGNTACGLEIVNCEKLKKVYLRFSKGSKFIKNGEQQSKTNFVLYTIPAAEELLKVLGGIISSAKNYKGV